MTNNIQVLDHGFVRLVDHMGSDLSVVRAARVSYDAAWRAGENEGSDRKLIHYLWKNHHCYHPSMEVLTVNGWKKWGNCGDKETFLVPDPILRKYRTETLDIKKFYIEEDIYAFENQRMSYKVTSNHKMWFKGHRESYFSERVVHSMPKWGWFDPITGYNDISNNDNKIDERFEFIGFYLGDGSFGSKNRLIFHLKKDRKKNYLRRILEKNNIEYKTAQSSTYKEAEVFYVTTPRFLLDYINPESKSFEKEFPLNELQKLDVSQIKGLFEGLVNSDGSIKKDRPQIQFSSVSENLLEVFCIVSTRLGYDCHYTYKNAVTAYSIEGRTSLESRKQYHYKEWYQGNVYCATTSTGFLAVRGGPTKFGFVCGNTSPFESVEFQFEVKAPIFVFRQWHRHRTFSYNELSARYRELPDEYYVPTLDTIGQQSTSNKQMRDMSQQSDQLIPSMIDHACHHSFEVYKNLIEKGCPRELARGVLPLNTYSHMFAKVNLHNLLHFLTLRTHEHAQYEIRVYAEGILNLIEDIVPICIEAWKETRK